MATVAELIAALNAYEAALEKANEKRQANSINTTAIPNAIGKIANIRQDLASLDGTLNVALDLSILITKNDAAITHALSEVATAVNALKTNKPPIQSAPNVTAPSSSASASSSSASSSSGSNAPNAMTAEEAEKFGIEKDREAAHKEIQKFRYNVNNKYSGFDYSDDNKANALDYSNDNKANAIDYSNDSKKQELITQYVSYCKYLLTKCNKTDHPNKAGELEAMIKSLTSKEKVNVKISYLDSNFYQIKAPTEKESPAFVPSPVKKAPESVSSSTSNPPESAISKINIRAYDRGRAIFVEQLTSKAGIPLKNNPIYKAFRDTEHGAQAILNNSEGKANTTRTPQQQLIDQIIYSFYTLGEAAEKESIGRSLLEDPETKAAVVSNPYAGINDTKAAQDLNTALQQAITLVSSPTPITDKIANGLVQKLSTNVLPVAEAVHSGNVAVLKAKEEQVQSNIKKTIEELHTAGSQSSAPANTTKPTSASSSSENASAAASSDSNNNNLNSGGAVPATNTSASESVPTQDRSKSTLDVPRRAAGPARRPPSKYAGNVEKSNKNSTSTSMNSGSSSTGAQPAAASSDSNNNNNNNVNSGAAAPTTSTNTASSSTGAQSAAASSASNNNNNNNVNSGGAAPATSTSGTTSANVKKPNFIPLVVKSTELNLLKKIKKLRGVDLDNYNSKNKKIKPETDPIYSLNTTTFHESIKNAIQFVQDVNFNSQTIGSLTYQNSIDCMAYGYYVISETENKAATGQQKKIIETLKLTIAILTSQTGDFKSKDKNDDDDQNNDHVKQVTDDYKKQVKNKYIKELTYQLASGIAGLCNLVATNNVTLPAEKSTINPTAIQSAGTPPSTASMTAPSSSSSSSSSTNNNNMAPLSAPARTLTVNTAPSGNNVELFKVSKASRKSAIQIITTVAGQNNLFIETLKYVGENEPYTERHINIIALAGNTDSRAAVLKFLEAGYLLLGYMHSEFDKTPSDTIKGTTFLTALQSNDSTGIFALEKKLYNILKSVTFVQVNNKKEPRMVLPRDLSKGKLFNTTITDPAEILKRLQNDVQTADISPLLTTSADERVTDFLENRGSGNIIKNAPQQGQLPTSSQPVANTNTSTSSSASQTSSNNTAGSSAAGSSDQNDNNNNNNIGETSGSSSGSSSSWRGRPNFTIPKLKFPSIFTKKAPITYRLGGEDDPSSASALTSAGIGAADGTGTPPRTLSNNTNNSTDSAAGSGEKPNNNNNNNIGGTLGSSSGSSSSSGSGQSSGDDNTADRLKKDTDAADRSQKIEDVTNRIQVKDEASATEALNELRSAEIDPSGNPHQNAVIKKLKDAKFQANLFSGNIDFLQESDSEDNEMDDDKKRSIIYTYMAYAKFLSSLIDKNDITFDPINSFAVFKKNIDEKLEQLYSYDLEDTNIMYSYTMAELAPEIDAVIARWMGVQSKNENSDESSNRSISSQSSNMEIDIPNELTPLLKTINELTIEIIRLASTKFIKYVRNQSLSDELIKLILGISTVKDPREILDFIGIQGESFDEIYACYPTIENARKEWIDVVNALNPVVDLYLLYEGANKATDFANRKQFTTEDIADAENHIKTLRTLSNMSKSLTAENLSQNTYLTTSMLYIGTFHSKLIKAIEHVKNRRLNENTEILLKFLSTQQYSGKLRHDRDSQIAITLCYQLIVNISETFKLLTEMQALENINSDHYIALETEMLITNLKNYQKSSIDALHKIADNAYQAQPSTSVNDILNSENISILNNNLLASKAALTNEYAKLKASSEQADQGKDKARLQTTENLKRQAEHIEAQKNAAKSEEIMNEATLYYSRRKGEVLSSIENELPINNNNALQEKIRQFIKLQQDLIIAFIAQSFIFINDEPIIRETIDKQLKVTISSLLTVQSATDDKDYQEKTKAYTSQYEKLVAISNDYLVKRQDDLSDKHLLIPSTTFEKLQKNIVKLLQINMLILYGEALSQSIQEINKHVQTPIYTEAKETATKLREAINRRILLLQQSIQENRDINEYPEMNSFRKADIPGLPEVLSRQEKLSRFLACHQEQPPKANLCLYYFQRELIKLLVSNEYRDKNPFKSGERYFFNPNEISKSFNDIRLPEITDSQFNLKLKQTVLIQNGLIGSYVMHPELNERNNFFKIKTPYFNMLVENCEAEVGVKASNTVKQPGRTDTVINTTTEDINHALDLCTKDLTGTSETVKTTISPQATTLKNEQSEIINNRIQNENNLLTIMLQTLNIIQNTLTDKTLIPKIINGADHEKRDHLLHAVNHKFLDLQNRIQRRQALLRAYQNNTEQLEPLPTDPVLRDFAMGTYNETDLVSGLCVYFYQTALPRSSTFITHYDDETVNKLKETIDANVFSKTNNNIVPNPVPSKKALLASLNMLTFIRRNAINDVVRETNNYLNLPHIPLNLALFPLINSSEPADQLLNANVQPDKPKHPMNKVFVNNLIIELSQNSLSSDTINLLAKVPIDSLTPYIKDINEIVTFANNLGTNKEVLTACINEYPDPQIGIKAFFSDFLDDSTNRIDKTKMKSISGATKENNRKIIISVLQAYLQSPLLNQTAQPIQTPPRRVSELKAEINALLTHCYYVIARMKREIASLKNPDQAWYFNHELKRFHDNVTRLLLMSIKDNALIGPINYAREVILKGNPEPLMPISTLSVPIPERLQDNNLVTLIHKKYDEASKKEKERLQKLVQRAEKKREESAAKEILSLNLFISAQDAASELLDSKADGTTAYKNTQEMLASAKARLSAITKAITGEVTHTDIQTVLDSPYPDIQQYINDFKEYLNIRSSDLINDPIKCQRFISMIAYYTTLYINTPVVIPHNSADPAKTEKELNIKKANHLNELFSILREVKHPRKITETQLSQVKAVFTVNVVTQIEDALLENVHNALANKPMIMATKLALSRANFVEPSSSSSSYVSRKSLTNKVITNLLEAGETCIAYEAHTPIEPPTDILSEMNTKANLLESTNKTTAQDQKLKGSVGADEAYQETTQKLLDSTDQLKKAVAYEPDPRLLKIRSDLETAMQAFIKANDPIYLLLEQKIWLCNHQKITTTMDIHLKNIENFKLGLKLPSRPVGSREPLYPFTDAAFNNENKTPTEKLNNENAKNSLIANAYYVLTKAHSELSNLKGNADQKIALYRLYYHLKTAIDSYRNFKINEKTEPDQKTFYAIEESMNALTRMPSNTDDINVAEEKEKLNSELTQAFEKNSNGDIVNMPEFLKFIQFMIGWCEISDSSGMQKAKVLLQEIANKINEVNKAREGAADKSSIDLIANQMNRSLASHVEKIVTKILLHPATLDAYMNNIEETTAIQKDIEATTSYIKDIEASISFNKMVNSLALSENGEGLLAFAKDILIDANTQISAVINNPRKQTALRQLSDKLNDAISSIESAPKSERSLMSLIADHEMITHLKRLINAINNPQFGMANDRPSIINNLRADLESALVLRASTRLKSSANLPSSSDEVSELLEYSLENASNEKVINFYTDHNRISLLSTELSQEDVSDKTISNTLAYAYYLIAKTQNENIIVAGDANDFAIKALMDKLTPLAAAYDDKQQQNNNNNNRAQEAYRDTPLNQQARALIPLMLKLSQPIAVFSKNDKEAYQIKLFINQSYLEDAIEDRIADIAYLDEEDSNVRQNDPITKYLDKLAKSNSQPFENYQIPNTVNNLNDIIDALAFAYFIQAKEQRENNLNKDKPIARQIADLKAGLYALLNAEDEYTFSFDQPPDGQPVEKMSYNPENMPDEIFNRVMTTTQNERLNRDQERNKRQIASRDWTTLISLKTAKPIVEKSILPAIKALQQHSLAREQEAAQRRPVAKEQLSPEQKYNLAYKSAMKILSSSQTQGDLINSISKSSLNLLNENNVNTLVDSLNQIKTLSSLPDTSIDMLNFLTLLTNEYYVQNAADISNNQILTHLNDTSLWLKRALIHMTGLKDKELRGHDLSATVNQLKSNMGITIAFMINQLMNVNAEVDFALPSEVNPTIYKLTDADYIYLEQKLKKSKSGSSHEKLLSTSIDNLNANNSDKKPWKNCPAPVAQYIHELLTSRDYDTTIAKQITQIHDNAFKLLNGHIADPNSLFFFIQFAIQKAKIISNSILDDNQSSDVSVYSKSIKNLNEIFYQLDSLYAALQHPFEISPDPDFINKVNAAIVELSKRIDAIYTEFTTNQTYTFVSTNPAIQSLLEQVKEADNLNTENRANNMFANALYIIQTTINSLSGLDFNLIEHKLESNQITQLALHQTQLKTLMTQFTSLENKALTLTQLYEILAPITAMQQQTMLLVNHYNEFVTNADSIFSFNKDQNAQDQHITAVTTASAKIDTYIKEASHDITNALTHALDKADVLSLEIIIGPNNVKTPLPIERRFFHRVHQSTEALREKHSENTSHTWLEKPEKKQLSLAIVKRPNPAKTIAANVKLAQDLAFEKDSNGHIVNPNSLFYFIQFTIKVIEQYVGDNPALTDAVTELNTLFDQLDELYAALQHPNEISTDPDFEIKIHAAILELSNRVKTIYQEFTAQNKAYKPKKDAYAHQAILDQIQAAAAQTDAERINNVLLSAGRMVDTAIRALTALNSDTIKEHHSPEQARALETQLVNLSILQTQLRYLSEKQPSLDQVNAIINPIVAIYRQVEHFINPAQLQQLAETTLLYDAYHHLIRDKSAAIQIRKQADDIDNEQRNKQTITTASSQVDALLNSASTAVKDALASAPDKEASDAYQPSAEIIAVRNHIGALRAAIAQMNGLSPVRIPQFISDLYSCPLSLVYAEIDEQDQFIKDHSRENPDYSQVYIRYTLQLAHQRIAAITHSTLDEPTKEHSINQITQHINWVNKALSKLDLLQALQKKEPINPNVPTQITRLSESTVLVADAMWKILRSNDYNQAIHFESFTDVNNFLDEMALAEISQCEFKISSLDPFTSPDPIYRQIYLASTGIINRFVENEFNATTIDEQSLNTMIKVLNQIPNMVRSGWVFVGSNQAKIVPTVTALSTSLTRLKTLREKIYTQLNMLRDITFIPDQMNAVMESLKTYISVAEEARQQSNTQNAQMLIKTTQALNQCTSLFYKQAEDLRSQTAAIIASIEKDEQDIVYYISVLDQIERMKERFNSGLKIGGQINLENRRVAIAKATSIEFNTIQERDANTRQLDINTVPDLDQLQFYIAFRVADALLRNPGVNGFDHAVNIIIENRRQLINSFYVDDLDATTNKNEIYRQASAIFEQLDNLDQMINDYVPPVGLQPSNIESGFNYVPPAPAASSSNQRATGIGFQLPSVPKLLNSLKNSMIDRLRGNEVIPSNNNNNTNSSAAASNTATSTTSTTGTSTATSLDNNNNNNITTNSGTTTTTIPSTNNNNPTVTTTTTTTTTTPENANASALNNNNNNAQINATTITTTPPATTNASTSNNNNNNITTSTSTTTTATTTTSTSTNLGSGADATTNTQNNQITGATPFGTPPFQPGLGALNNNNTQPRDRLSQYSNALETNPPSPPPPFFMYNSGHALSIGDRTQALSLGQGLTHTVQNVIQMIVPESVSTRGYTGGFDTNISVEMGENINQNKTEVGRIFVRKPADRSRYHSDAKYGIISALQYGKKQPLIIEGPDDLRLEAIKICIMSNIKFRGTRVDEDVKKLEAEGFTCTRQVTQSGKQCYSGVGCPNGINLSDYTVDSNPRNPLVVQANINLTIDNHNKTVLQNQHKPFGSPPVSR